MSRTFVMGDIHGAHTALVQVLERSGFDKENDRLIFLGDITDGWPEILKCIDELLTIRNLITLRGNHDDWTMDWLFDGINDRMWYMQGGAGTIAEFGNNCENVSDAHRKYFKNTKFWYEDGDRIFAHAGWSHPKSHPQFATDQDLCWNRDFWKLAMGMGHRDGEKITNFKEVFIGHTPVVNWGFGKPTRMCEVWNMDTGAGYGYSLSIMDVDTKEVWQSDNVQSLYPGIRAR